MIISIYRCLCSIYFLQLWKQRRKCGGDYQDSQEQVKAIKTLKILHKRNFKESPKNLPKPKELIGYDVSNGIYMCVVLFIIVMFSIILGLVPTCQSKTFCSATSFVESNVLFLHTVHILSIVLFTFLLKFIKLESLIKKSRHSARQ